MAAVTVTPSLVRVPIGTIPKAAVAGEALSVGDVVYIHTDGTVLKAINTSAAAAQARGVVISVETYGATDAAIGATVGVVFPGDEVEIGGDQALTPGAVCYVSATAGKLDQSASATSGRFNYPFAFARTTSILRIGFAPVPTAVP